MTNEDSNLFVAEYNSKTSAIQAAEYTLEVDCVDMPVVTADMADELTEVMKLYKSTGFNQVIFQTKGSNTLKLQLNRLSRNAGLTNVSVVNIG